MHDWYLTLKLVYGWSEFLQIFEFAGYLLVDAVVPNMWPGSSIEDMVFSQIVFYATNSSAMELSWGDHPPMAHTMFGKL